MYTLAIESKLAIFQFNGLVIEWTELIINKDDVRLVHGSRKRKEAHYLVQTKPNP